MTGEAETTDQRGVQQLIWVRSRWTGGRNHNAQQKPRRRHRHQVQADNDDEEEERQDRKLLIVWPTLH